MSKQEAATFATGWHRTTVQKSVTPQSAVQRTPVDASKASPAAPPVHGVANVAAAQSTKAGHVLVPVTTKTEKPHGGMPVVGSNPVQRKTFDRAAGNR